jgi:hypothetical protein
VAVVAVVAVVAAVVVAVVMFSGILLVSIFRMDYFKSIITMHKIP